MTVFRILMLCVGWFLISGCEPKEQVETTETNPSTETTPPAKEMLVGKWATSTDPEMEATRHVLTLKESGEFSVQSPFMNPLNQDEQLSIEQDGKTILARITFTGSWKLEGDRLKAQINDTDQPSIELNDREMEWKVISNSEKKLELEGQGEGGEFVTYFREE